MKRIQYFGIVLLVITLSSFLVYSVTKKEIHIGSSMYVPSEVGFSDEKAPLEVYDVKERFERELLVNANLHSSTILIIKRANRAFPVIEPILKEYNVPDDFKYLAVIESALTNAVSSAGARGFWQFMEPTAKENGMEVSVSVDERYHLVKSTHAACNYLLKAKEKFGSWTLAAASYNAGMNGILNQLESQKVTNYYDLLLNEETSRYVFRILALKQIMQNPQNFGFTVNKEDLYQLLPTKKIEIDSSINDLAQFAINQGINYKILKLHNPWLRDKKLLNTSKKKYIIEIPTEGY
jgi:membrane-bound lytic murein transglycosylase D